MSWVSDRRGRPRYVAEIDFPNDALKRLYDDFYQSCSTLCYRDIMALSRALKVSTRAVESWKYKEKMPPYQRIIQVIEWVKRGKPMIQEKQGHKSVMLR